MQYLSDDVGDVTRPSALMQWRRFSSRPEIKAAILLLLACLFFGSSRDFGAFLLSIPVLIGLGLLALGFVIAAWFEGEDRPSLLLSCLLIAAAPVTFSHAYGAFERVSFYAWAMNHREELRAASRRDGLVIRWDSWGFGSGTDAYLLVDTKDRLRTEERYRE
ncbi:MULTISPECIES: hypothetical protein [Sphingomonas]|uniref:hypothetical protein n=1 Tax=Sphingomonas TaxID=13687 RepID=UPI000DEEE498|nr:MULTISPECIES: hypothetical protein [Sphingomonas]